jgi:two-component system LytT family sensor kinase
MEKRKKLLMIVWVLLAGFILLQYSLASYLELKSLNFWDVIMYPIGNFLTGILLLFVLVIPIFDYSSRMRLRQRAFFLLAAGILYSFLFSVVLHLLPALKFSGNWENFSLLLYRFVLSDFHNVLKNFVFQIAILFAFEYLSRERNTLLENSRLEIELNQTKLQILKSQLQPHFLFNALNSVVSVIDENKSKAQEMLVNLSDILRTTLNSNFRELAPLEKEIEYIKTYLSIEKIRYEDQLDCDIFIDKKVAKLNVPNLILQPIVENAIKHGFKGIQRTLKLVISADFDEKVVIVKNNGAPLSIRQQNHGIKNVSERLSIFYPGRDSFKLYQDGDWVVNKIYLG